MKYENSKRLIIFPLILAAGVMAGILAGRVIGHGDIERRTFRRAALSSVKGSEKLNGTLALIEGKYVDSVSIDSLTEKVIPLLVRELDPHSVYIPAAEMQELNEPLEGEFDGIGVVFNMATDTVIVLNVIPSGPSDRAGVRSGDRIVEVNDTLIAGVKMPQREVMKRLRGERGSEVRLTIHRREIDEPVDITVIRGAIPIKSIEAALILEDSTAYIRLSQFARTSHQELLRALARLSEEGMRRLILDLRGNSGGYLDQAIALANEFLPKGRMIVYTEDRYHNRTEEFSNGSGQWSELPLAILIDEESASSSEILAGAVQDNDRGWIVGRRSFGKGLVQQQIPYPDGSALRLTVARYYTPTGRSIQRPYTMGDDESYMHDIIDRYEHNEFFSADSIRFADSLRFTTRGGRVVYGGGGIMPDVFVPLDTTRVSNYFIEVSGRNILYRYTIEYADRHRRALDAVRSVDDLRALLDSDKRLVEDFVRYAERQGVKPVAKDIERSRDIIEAQLRAFIGRNTSLEDNGFHANIYKADTVVMRTLHLLKEQPEN